MSQSSGSARDYVESYVKETGRQDNDYLSEKQPRYDPTKIPDAPTTPSTATGHPPAPTQETEPKSQFPSFHAPTVNPMPSTEESSEQPQQQPQVVWAVRDFMDQKQEIHETALANCADLHEDLIVCFKNGSWWDKAKMCEAQKKKFWNCYHTQKKFLKDVNYKGPISTQEDDDVKLYQALKLRDEMDTKAPEASAASQ
ncbi:uncharacterized protein BYT42DRAFT_616288 [Radiomyces spectabilis]|uniref:uncharacterized protein n=1 Tax=Radiomyces spectabilis TaxID=64574 RepID=UPI00221F0696|nr:uncharacterized protein BYT42DRAFT_616288 [Radiomyces spectabilis]KAI8373108.1 hypothetical protein BYT42DRAFT_616288 [Radiomyces spectabilis]